MNQGKEGEETAYRKALLLLWGGEGRLFPLVEDAEIRTILYRGYYKGVPEECFEKAKINGETFIRIRQKFWDWSFDQFFAYFMKLARGYDNCYNSEITIKRQKTVVAVDLDDCALKNPFEVNKLFENPDNFIVIYTSRSESIREQTRKELSELNVKYHALVMEKMRADIYIDDRNCGGLQWPTQK